MDVWDVFIDIGFASLLLLIGTFIRAKVETVQRLFLPASIIAGLLGLILGPNVLGWIPFTDMVGVYPAILIAVIWGLLPLISESVDWEKIRKKVGSLWAYSQFAMLAQWRLGTLLGLLILSTFFDAPLGFGLILGAGFAGGHGTAAALGDAFSQLGWEEATDLAMTSATVGIISAVVIGLFFIKRGTVKGETNYLDNYKDLSPELRTGLI